MTQLFLEIVDRSIMSGWLILLVLLLRFLFKKNVPKWMIVAMWGLVAVRLICPITIESPVSLMPDTDKIRSEMIVETPETFKGVFVSETEPLPKSQKEGISVYEPIESEPFVQDWTEIYKYIWLTGMGALLLYMCVTYWNLKKSVQTAIPLEKNVYQCETVRSPFILGLVHPKVYLPFELSGLELSSVVEHEQAHLKRMDHIWKLLGFLLLSIYWFHPFVWVAYVMLCRDIELACDEKVIKNLLPEQRAAYSEILLQYSVPKHNITVCPLAFGEVGIKERVKNVLNYKKPTFGVIITAVLVCIVMVVCFLTNPVGEDTAIGIIGGADGPTAIIVAESEEMLSPDEYNEQYFKEEPVPTLTPEYTLVEPEEPYLGLYLISEEHGETAYYLKLTNEEKEHILSEELVDLKSAGYGLCAGIHHNDGEITTFTEFYGIPQTIIDMAVEKCGYKLESPKEISAEITEAKLKCDWLAVDLYADEQDLPRLEEILKNAEQGYVGKCGYGARLTITMSDGREMILYKGCDDCDTIIFGSYGGYFLGDKENSEFWEMFGLSDRHSNRL